MDISMKRTANRVKAAVRQRQGPARREQDATPIADAMRAFWERDMLSFSIPAHGGGRGPAPEFTRWAGIDAARFDLPMSHGVDTRDRAWQVQSTAQELFAEAVGAKQTLFSTNGSSMSVRVAIMTVAGPGDVLVMARNGHKSSFAGLVLSGAQPRYVDPYYDTELEIALGVLPGDLAAALDAERHARAALVFTPSYYGTTPTSALSRPRVTSASCRSSPTTRGAWTTSSAAIRTCQRGRCRRVPISRSARSTRA
jgi:arginine decarboxylase